MLTHEQAFILGDLVRAGKIQVKSVYNPETKISGLQVMVNYGHIAELQNVLHNVKYTIYREWNGDD